MSSLPTRVLYYGKDEELPEQIPLRAGPLTLVYAAGDLRTIKVTDRNGENREVLRRIYVAIRDRNWGTVPNVLTNLVMDVHPDHFAITFDVGNHEGPIDFAWRGVITGGADGTLTYAMQGIARSTFMRNRIGFCILHPAEIAGAACTIEHVGGATEQADLPVLIQPQQPLKPFDELAALTHTVAPGLRAELRFGGDIFEMEDQRNWTDASFKTFCTPLRIPYPVEIAEGTRIEQTLTLRILDDRPAATRPVAGSVAAPAALSSAVHFGLAGGELPLPRLGLVSAASLDDTGDPELVTRLRALHLDHLRLDLNLDLRLGEQDTAARLRAGMAEAEAVGVPLHLALYVGADPDAELAAAAALVRALKPTVARWLVYPSPEKFLGGSPTAAVLAAAHRHLDGLSPSDKLQGAPLASGTDADLIFLQRNVPPLDQVDLLTFSLNPQVHAFDNLSLVETLATQGAAVKTAQHLAQGKPVMVSPVTLKQRYNPYATAAPAPTPAAELPANVDVRQLSLFAAGWTVGSVKYTGEAGADAVTYFETVGWRGVLEREAGSPVPASFPSVPGGVFPLYHILADLGEFAGGVLLPSRSAAPLTVDGLVLQQARQQRTLVANLTPEPQTVVLDHVTGPCQVRVLDETTALHAIASPDAFRLALAAPAAPATAAGLHFSLRPYAVATVDVER